jgi:integrase
MIQAVLNFAVQQRRIPFNPTLKLRKLSRGQPEMLFWNQEEAESFLSYANEYYPPESEDRWIYVSYLVALNTGMRAGEIWGLQPQDLAADGRSIHVRRQWNRVSHSYTTPKSRKGRLVPCVLHLADELRKLVARKRTKPDQAIFAGETGRPINHDSFTDRRFEMDLKRWGGRRIRFHDMRHTATTLMLASGVDYKTVQEVCGHASFKTTMNYVHLLPGHVERVLERFGLAPEKPSNVLPLER